jgi:hypothetical protein
MLAGWVSPLEEVLSNQFLVRMSYCLELGFVLQELADPNGAVHKPWNMLSGVRFS